jgi:hypothetical protein
MHYARHDSSACVWKQFIFMIGGLPEVPSGTKIERYNMDHDMWSVLPVQLPKFLCRSPAFTAPNDRIAILGG